MIKNPENVIYNLPFHDIGHFLLLFKEIHDIGNQLTKYFSTNQMTVKVNDTTVYVTTINRVGSFTFFSL